MLENWIAKHWFALFSGSILMGVALKIAYIERGSMEFGSEWLIIPVVLLVDGIMRSYKRKLRRCRKRSCRR